MDTRKKLRIHCQVNDIPLISLNTERFLEQRIIDNQPKCIAEIGSAIGYSTSVLAESMMVYNTYGILHSREISYPHYRQSNNNISRRPMVHLFLGNVCLMPLERYVGNTTYDMIFIDGRKTETLYYIQLFMKYIHHTSTIIIDDAIKFKGKMNNLYQFLDSKYIQYTIEQLDEDDGILILPVTPLLLQALSSL